MCSCGAVRVRGVARGVAAMAVPEEALRASTSSSTPGVAGTSGLGAGGWPGAGRSGESRAAKPQLQCTVKGMRFPLAGG